jgi:hypothetical protein
MTGVLCFIVNVIAGGATAGFFILVGETIADGRTSRKRWFCWAMGTLSLIIVAVNAVVWSHQ